MPSAAGSSTTKRTRGCRRESCRTRCECRCESDWDDLREQGPAAYHGEAECAALPLSPLRPPPSLNSLQCSVTPYIALYLLTLLCNSLHCSVTSTDHSPQADTLGKSFISTMNENISRNLYTAFLHDLFAQVRGP